jgi:hypothetical protein
MGRVEMFYLLRSLPPIPNLNASSHPGFLCATGTKAEAHILPMMPNPYAFMPDDPAAQPAEVAIIKNGAS